MAAIYVDTSALGRILLRESDAPTIRTALGGFESRLASRLTRIELRRLGLRSGRLAEADRLLGDLALLPLDDDLLGAAESVLPTTVATLDAIHLATAIRLAAAGDLDALMTYDRRLADGARHHGIPVLSPA